MSEKWPVHYGDQFVGGELADRTTIHGSTTIDVQLDAATGEVCAVWFRCLELPFRVSNAGSPEELHSGGGHGIKVTAVQYVEDP